MGCSGSPSQRPESGLASDKGLRNPFYDQQGRSSSMTHFNDGFGMSGVKGFRASLAKKPGTESIVAKIDEILQMTGNLPARNNIGPIGVHTRDTSIARNGYQSLKQWEMANNTRCRLVITMSPYDQAATFMAYASYKNEPWVYSVSSIAAGERLINLLEEKKAKNLKVIATQVVPPLDSALPVVVDARKALGERINYIALEGYLVGRLLIS